MSTPSTTKGSLNILASGSAMDLLENDAKQPENRIADHPIWASALDGSLPKARLKALLLAFYPAVAGPGRYAFAAKVSSINAEDGKELFQQLYDLLKVPEANADTGWKKLLTALGATERECSQALAEPSAEAEDLIEVIRTHGLQSSATEASCIAWLLERRLPVLWGRLAASLEANYGLRKADTQWLHYQADRAAKSDKWINHLARTYIASAEPYKVFEGRRAAREAIWAWTVLTETV